MQISPSPRQRPTSHKPRKPLIPDPKLPRPGRTTEDLLLARLELIDVPRGEDDLVSEELCLGRGDPDEEVSREGDCNR